MTIHLHDRKLAKRLLGRDEQAFTDFYDGYFPRVYRFARMRLNGDAEAARQIVHDTFSRAIRKLHTYRGEASLFTWLCTICRNEIYDYFAKRARDQKHLVFVEDLADVQAAVDASVAQFAQPPETEAQRMEIARLIQVALDQLPTNYGDVLEWKYVYGLSAQEIGHKLSMGEVAVHSLLARAKRAFKDVFRSLSEPVGNGATIAHLFEFGQ